MSKTITQKIAFKNTPAGTLYAMYLDSKHHTALTGGKANISAKEGAKFNAWNGHILGKNLQLVKNKLIVQSWRNPEWNKETSDSSFIMLFSKMARIP
jgi:activator of HSP90 ATPase